MKKKIIFVLLGLSLVLTACGQQLKQKEENQVLKIGVIAPMSGFVSILGERVENGLSLALEEINKDGQKIELIYEDGKCIDPEAAVGAYRKLVDIDEVGYIFGPLCVETSKAVLSEVREDGDVLLFTLGAVSERSDLSGKRVFSFVFNIEQEDEKLAKFAGSELGAETAALLSGNTDWGVNHQKNFTEYFEKAGGSVVVSEFYNYGDTDFRTQILKIKEAGSDVVYLIENGGNTIVSIYKQMVEMGIESKILAQYTFEHPDVLNAPEDVLERTYYSWPLDSSVVSDQEILELSAYDGLKVFYGFYEECGDDKDCMVGRIKNLKNYQGMSGEFSIDRFGEAERSFSIKTVRDGKFVVYE